MQQPNQRRTGLASLVGAAEDELRERLGPPRSRATTGDEVWLTFVIEAGGLRVRCRPDPSGRSRVASWTLSLADGRRTLAEAAGEADLWPAVEPDVAAADLDVPLVRRPVSSGAGAVHSFTATVRDGRFDRLSVFDESPDWL